MKQIIVYLDDFVYLTYYDEEKPIYELLRFSNSLIGFKIFKYY